MFALEEGAAAREARAKAPLEGGAVDTAVASYSREVEIGNVEYKLKLVDVRASRFEQLVTQLKWRLAEGEGEAVYEIGVADNGSLKGLDEKEMSASLHTLQRMCERLEVHMIVLHKRLVPPSKSLTVAEVVIRVMADRCGPRREARVAFLGGAQAGKSTLIAALATGQLDNGEGSARTLVMRHMHELESGTTSSISQQVIGFDAAGALLNSAGATFGTSTAADVVERAEQIVTLLDLCGDRRYLKTTLYGLTAHVPDLVVLVVRVDDLGDRAELTARLHAALASSLRLPCIVVLSCADTAASEMEVSQAADELIRMLAAEGYPRPTLVSSLDDLDQLDEFAPAPAPASPSPPPLPPSPPQSPPGALGGVTPVMVTSSRTGRGLALLARCLTRLQLPTDWAAMRREPALLTIHGRHPPPSSAERILAEDEFSPHAAMGDPWLSSPGTTPSEVGPHDNAIFVEGTLLLGMLESSLTHVHSSRPAAAMSEQPALGDPGCFGNGLHGSKGMHNGTTGDAVNGSANGSANGYHHRHRASYVIGPNAAGRWTPVSVLSIKYKQLNVSQLEAGQSATLCLQVHDARTKLRRGMVLREETLESAAAPHEESPPPPCRLLGGSAAVVWELEAVVRAIQLPNAVPVGTEVVLHCVGVKQAARLLSLRIQEDGTARDGLDDNERMRAGCEATLRFRFVHAAEFVRCGTRCVFRDGSGGAENIGLGVGVVTRLVC